MSDKKQKAKSKRYIAMKLVPDQKLDIYNGMFKILIEAKIEEPITSTINHELPFYYYGDDEVIYLSNIDKESAKQAYDESCR